jgi:hypothetical protein
MRGEGHCRQRAKNVISIVVNARFQGRLQIQLSFETLQICLTRRRRSSTVAPVLCCSACARLCLYYIEISVIHHHCHMLYSITGAGVPSSPSEAQDSRHYNISRVAFTRQLKLSRVSVPSMSPENTYQSPPIRERHRNYGTASLKCSGFLMKSAPNHALRN